MLFLLMLHITKQFLKRQGITIDFKQVLYRLLTGLKYGVPFLLISFNENPINNPPSESLYFDIVKKEKKLGYIRLEKIHLSETTEYNIKSEVNTKLVFNFKASSKETYIYKGDTLIHSSIYRTLNSRVKVDQTINYKNGSYHLKRKGRKKVFNSNIIRCNLVMLFFEKPKGVSKVFCDKQQVYVDIVQINSEAFKVIFPDKSYTIFYYNGNRCESIEAVGSFYHVQLIPKYSTKKLKVSKPVKSKTG